MCLKKYKIVKALPVLLMTVCLIAGCGDNSGGAAAGTSTVTVTENATENTEAGNNSEEPKEKGIKDLYQATDVQDLYKITDIDLNGYSIGGGEIKDDYALLIAWSDKENSNRIMLLNLKHPEENVSMNFEDAGDNFYLLQGGLLLRTSMQDSYTVYDSKLNILYEFDGGCGSYAGSRENNELWFFTSDNQLVLHKDGQVSQTVQLTGIDNIYEYMGDANGKSWFKMMDEEFYTGYYSINLTNWSFEKEEGFLWDPSSQNGRLVYDSEDRWYFADMEDPLTITAFTKTYSNETTWKIGEHFLLGVISELDARENFTENLRVYDKQNGGECASLLSSQFTDIIMHPVDFNNDIVLLWASDNNMKYAGLYLWDLSGKEASQPAAYYERLDYHVSQEKIDQLVSEFLDTYGIEIYYDKEHLEDAGGVYNLKECTDINKLCFALQRLSECTKEYPQGFYQDLKGDNYQHIRYYLCADHERTVDYSIENAAATTNLIGDSIIMTIDVNELRDFRRTLLHETMHMMESRIEQETFNNQMSYVEYWGKYINSPEYPLMYDYNWERNGESLKGVYGFGDEDTWYYVDDYAKCTFNEDRARVLENQIYSASSSFFEGEHLNKKARFLNAQIREAFPCVKNSSEEVLWEHMTGIVNMNEEFPEYIQMINN